jgi:polyhydroxyalkanoate synthesis repressor PhaR
MPPEPVGPNSRYVAVRVRSTSALASSFIRPKFLHGGGASATLLLVQRTKKRSKRGRPPVRETTDPNVTLIKKYGNRRLYDTRRSRYITLEELGHFLSAGEEVRVVDSKSGEDLTKRVVTKLIFLEEERGRIELLPLSFLRKLLQHRGPENAMSAEIDELKARLSSLETRLRS